MQALAKPAYLSRFLFSGLPTVAGLCALGGVEWCRKQLTQRGSKVCGKESERGKSVALLIIVATAAFHRHPGPTTCAIQWP